MKLHLNMLQYDTAIQCCIHTLESHDVLFINLFKQKIQIISILCYVTKYFTLNLFPNHIALQFQVLRNDHKKYCHSKRLTKEKVSEESCSNQIRQ